MQLQNEYDCYFFIADWHALTTDYADTSQVKANIARDGLRLAGRRARSGEGDLFMQCHVPQHAELHLLLAMITPLGWLERVPTYKEQQENLTDKDLSTYGFLGYPLLMAADILIYQAALCAGGRGPGRACGIDARDRAPVQQLLLLRELYGEAAEVRRA